MTPPQDFGLLLSQPTRLRSADGATAIMFIKRGGNSLVKFLAQRDSKWNSIAALD